MSAKCPSESCPAGPESGQIVRKGFYRRKSDSKRIQRFQCRSCGKRFSSATNKMCYGQNKRRLNALIFRELCSNTSMRRTAENLGVSRKTVARKLEFLARWARLRNELLLKNLIQSGRFKSAQLDEMETNIHTKCKPASIALAVTKSRIILGTEVSKMPPNGRIAEIARKKYGPRRDERAQGFRRLLKSIEPWVDEESTFTSDQCPRYPAPIQRHYPKATHRTVKGRRGCVAGQGELKKGGFDPLFSLNHTCAMFRANVSRLIRKTWCVSKKISALEDHLALYTYFHNKKIAEKLTT